jgi:hypothetical protein
LYLETSKDIYSEIYALLSEACINAIRGDGRLNVELGGLHSACTKLTVVSWLQSNPKQALAVHQIMSVLDDLYAPRIDLDVVRYSTPVNGYYCHLVLKSMIH